MSRSLVLTVIAFAGCGYARPDADLVKLASAYRAVRSGAHLVAEGDRVLFCAAGDGVRVERTWPETFDDQDTEQDYQTLYTVRQVLAGDPDLRGESIDAEIDRGVIHLRGHVRSDEIAIRAARDLIALDGVSYVVVRLLSPESSSPVHLVSLPWYRCSAEEVRGQQPLNASQRHVSGNAGAP